MRAFFGAAALLGLSVVSSAQSISSFVNVNSINNVSASLSGLNLTLNVGSAPSFTLGSNTYTITEVWGVWALDDTNDFTATGVNQGIWNFNSNFAGFGGIAGWKTQTPNQGLTANQSATLAYSSKAGSVEGFGYHVRVAGTLQGGGNTIHIRAGAVPEPASLAALGFGALALLRRRRKA